MLLKTFNFYTDIPQQELENYAKNKLTYLEGQFSQIHSKIKTYLNELNKKTNIPNPELNWEADLLSSSFFTRIVFTHNYVRSLINQTFNSNYAVISSQTYPYLASFFRKLFNYIIENSDLINAIDKAIFYALVSGKLAIYVEQITEINEFGELQDKVKIEPIHPLHILYTKDYSTIIINKYLPLEEFKLIESTFPFFTPEMLQTPTEEKPEPSQTPTEIKPEHVKISEVYTRYITENKDVVLLKLYVLNNRHLIKVVEINNYVKELPFILQNFYADDIESSLADLIYDYYKEQTILLRKTIDRILLSTTLGLIVNTDNLEDDKEFIIQPYTIIKARGTEDVIKPFQIATFDPNILPILTLLQTEIQNISGLTEFLMGQPSNRSRITAKEVEIKTLQSQQFFNTLINRLEETFIKKLILKTMTEYIKLLVNNQVILSLLDLTAEEYQAFMDTIATDEVKNKPHGYTATKLLHENIIVKCNGMTSRINAQLQSQKLLELLQILAQFNLIGALNIPQVLTTLIQSMGITTEYINLQALQTPPQPTNEDTGNQTQQ